MTLERQLARAYLTEHPTEAARALERLPVERRAAVFKEAAGVAAPALAEMVAPAAAESLAALAPADAAPALDALTLDRALLLLRRMPADAADRVMSGLPADKQESLRRALTYAEGTAGALMDPAVWALPADISVADARVRLRAAARGLLHYLFVVDRQGVLVGVLDIPELMQARARDALGAIMQTRVEALPAWTPAAAVRAHPGWRSFHALPVVDEGGRLVGVIRYKTLRKLEDDGDGGRSDAPTAVTVGALGELFHLGLAGIVEGVATVASTSGRRGGSRPATTTGGEE